MKLFTMKLIKAVKQSEDSDIWTITKLISEECDCPQSRYSLNDVVHILHKTVVDYLSSCDDPISEIREYFYLYNDNLVKQEEIHRLIVFLRMVAVKNHKNQWINGFNELYEEI